eukprot:13465-Pyramimonas_sp.AAC.1
MTHKTRTNLTASARGRLQTQSPQRLMHGNPRARVAMFCRLWKVASARKRAPTHLTQRLGPWKPQAYAAKLRRLWRA